MERRFTKEAVLLGSRMNRKSRPRISSEKLQMTLISEGLDNLVPNLSSILKAVAYLEMTQYKPQNLQQDSRRSTGMEPSLSVTNLERSHLNKPRTLCKSLSCHCLKRRKTSSTICSISRRKRQLRRRLCQIETLLMFSLLLTLGLTFSGK